MFANGRACGPGQPAENIQANIFARLILGAGFKKAPRAFWNEPRHCLGVHLSIDTNGRRRPAGNRNTPQSIGVQ